MFRLIKRKSTGKEDRFGVLDVVKDLLLFFFVVFGTAAYVVLILLIISFLTLSYLHFTIEGMLIAGAVCGALAGIYYIVRTVKKYRRSV